MLDIMSRYGQYYIAQFTDHGEQIYFITRYTISILDITLEEIYFITRVLLPVYRKKQKLDT